MNGKKNKMKAKSNIEMINTKVLSNECEKTLNSSNSTDSLITNSEEHGMKIVMNALEKSTGSLGMSPQNKTFSNEKVRDIERRNAILLKKIAAHSQRSNRFTPAPVNEKLSNSAVNRKKRDWEIGQNSVTQNPNNQTFWTEHAETLKQFFLMTIYTLYHAVQ
ncbi:hypothetical protein FQA39_LY10393 [Lamprigera yunnana]|nr:hypothetical protein FQA39_LY10393 [Lamprigera yunnana]